MKITNKQLVPGMLVAAAIVSGGAYLALSNNPNSAVEQVAFAYTSTTNPVESTTAPNDYVITFPDANLQAALNAHITRNTGVARTATQPITAAEMRTATMQLFYGNNTLGSKSISNLEGVQYLTVAKANRQVQPHTKLELLDWQVLREYANKFAHFHAQVQLYP